MKLYFGQLALTSATELYARAVLILQFWEISNSAIDAECPTESATYKNFGFDKNLDFFFICSFFVEGAETRGADFFFDCSLFTEDAATDACDACFGVEEVRLIAECI